MGNLAGAPLRATDANNDRLTYSISCSDAFGIVASTGQLRTLTELDREDQEQHLVRVTATDPGNTSDDIAVTITVEDVDETPVISGPTSPEVAENGNTGVARYSATDPDGKTICWTLDRIDGNAFTLTGGGLRRTLTSNNPPDFETKNRYRVTLEAREQGDGTSTARLSVTVIVNNVDEPGMLQANTEAPQVGNTLRLKVEDEDGGESLHVWKWERGDPNSPCGTRTNWQTIPGVLGSSYTPTAADRGKCLRVTAFYRDRAGANKTVQFSTSETVEFRHYFDSDEATASVTENSAVGHIIGQFRASHSNSNETLTYSLSGVHATYFTVDNNGLLSTSPTPLNYEGQPGPEAEVGITATDSNNQTDTIAVAVSIPPECASAGEPPCAPGAPSVSSASDTSLIVAWTLADAPSGTPITGYGLQYREPGTNGIWITRSVSGTGRSCIIENLRKGTPYEVQVRAQNDIGEYGEWSSSGTGTPGYVPPPPPPKEDKETTTTTTMTTPSNNGGGSVSGGGFVAVAPRQPPGPMNNFQPVGQVFRQLATNGTLRRVLRLIEPSQHWLFYDPRPEFGPFNTLRAVDLASDPPAVAILQVSRGQQFHGMTLDAGWNFIPLTTQPLARGPGSGGRSV